MCVMMPTAHLEPGVVASHSVGATGILDLGRFPEGTDDVDDELAAALLASRCESVARPDIMRWKFRKLLGNLGNAVQALCGTGAGWRETGPVRELLVEEGERVLAGAGISPVSEAEDDERRADHLRLGTIDGRPRGGGSTWQSLARGSGIETDFLNGEIALLGRLHGVPAPANARIQALMTRLAARGKGPGSMTPQELLAALTG
jgi:2-dehydropantoate 2-reductase